MRTSSLSSSIPFFLLGVFSLPLLGCGTTTTAPGTSPPSGQIDPAGIWIFNIRVTVATGICAGEEGDSSAFPITITKTGEAPPYQVTARGFLGVETNMLTGTFDANNRLLLNSGSYPEEDGVTTPVHDLTATSESQMTGTETWNFQNSQGSCPGSESSVTATFVARVG
ncbi:MAG: hypothetical protein ACC682_12450 [Gemmatimonadota bacterium]